MMKWMRYSISAHGLLRCQSLSDISECVTGRHKRLIDFLETYCSELEKDEKTKELGLISEFISSRLLRLFNKALQFGVSGETAISVLMGIISLKAFSYAYRTATYNYNILFDDLAKTEFSELMDVDPKFDLLTYLDSTNPADRRFSNFLLSNAPTNVDVLNNLINGDADRTFFENRNAHPEYILACPEFYELKNRYYKKKLTEIIEAELDNSIEPGVFLETIDFIYGKLEKCADYRQSHLNENLIEYTKLFKTALSDIRWQSGRGLCHGWTYLYLFYKSLGDESTFFRKLKVISDCRDVSQLTPDEKVVFEEITGQVVVAQFGFLRKEQVSLEAESIVINSENVNQYESYQISEDDFINLLECISSGEFNMFIYSTHESTCAVPYRLVVVDGRYLLCQPPAWEEIKFHMNMNRLDFPDKIEFKDFKTLQELKSFIFKEGKVFGFEKADVTLQLSQSFQSNFSLISNQLSSGFDIEFTNMIESVMGLKELSEQISSLPKETMIDLSFKYKFGHSMGIYIKDNRYFFYNSNNHSGELEFDFPLDLAHFILKTYVLQIKDLDSIYKKKSYIASELLQLENAVMDGQSSPEIQIRVYTNLKAQQWHAADLFKATVWDSKIANDFFQLIYKLNDTKSFRFLLNHSTKILSELRSGIGNSVKSEKINLLLESRIMYILGHLLAYSKNSKELNERGNAKFTFIKECLLLTSKEYPELLDRALSQIEDVDMLDAITAGIKEIITTAEQKPVTENIKPQPIVDRVLDATEVSLKENSEQDEIILTQQNLLLEMYRKKVIFDKKICSFNQFIEAVDQESFVTPLAEAFRTRNPEVIYSCIRSLPVRNPEEQRFCELLSDEISPLRGTAFTQTRQPFVGGFLI